MNTNGYSRFLFGNNVAVIRSYPVPAPTKVWNNQHPLIFVIILVWRTLFNRTKKISLLRLLTFCYRPMAPRFVASLSESLLFKNVVNLMLSKVVKVISTVTVRFSHRFTRSKQNIYTAIAIPFSLKLPEGIFRVAHNIVICLSTFNGNLWYYYYVISGTSICW